MACPAYHRLPELFQRFRQQFPKAVCQAHWQAVEPRRYPREVTARALVLSTMRAFTLRLSGTRAIAEDPGLPDCAHNTVSTALARPSSAAFVERLVKDLERAGADDEACDDETFEAVDGMPYTLPKTRRHRCRKVNNKTVGGGVIWSLRLDKRRRSPRCPVRVLKVVEGAWHDGHEMVAVPLTPGGPIYLLDRGFYTLYLLERWLKEGVRFLGRARRKDLVYEVLEPYAAPHVVGQTKVLLDARVRLGGPRAKHHPEVRLVWAVLPSGEDLVLVTSLDDPQAWSAARLLAGYKRRSEVETFHQFLKDTLGLAHAYSFAWTGMRFLLYTALLMALLLYTLAEEETGQVVKLMRAVLRRLRRACGLGAPWKRNTAAPRRNKKKPKPRPLPPPLQEALKTLEQ